MVNDRAIKFSRQKAKELLVYRNARLRGTSATRGRYAPIFLRKSTRVKAMSILKKAVQSLKKTLSKYNAEDVLVHRRNAYSVNTNLISCDYYDYLDRKPGAEKLYRGEFIKQYSWAEVYVYHLENY